MRKASKRLHHASSARALGVAGAIGGGVAINSLGVPQPSAFLIAGLIGAAAGAAAMLAGYRVIFRRA
jgi:uncharacterized membrane protein YeaQ/YmgE (transglycosylase-associated protein family)